MIANWQNATATETVTHDHLHQRMLTSQEILCRSKRFLYEKV